MPIWGILFLVCLGLPACRPALKTSEQAKPVPLLDRDPLENGAHPARWAQWRGTNAAGVASAGSPAIHWSDTQGFRWKSTVPGRGNSSPVVWDGKIFLTTELDVGDPHQLSLLCFDLADGRLLWQSQAVNAFGRTHAKNGHASSSVATDGERVFAFFGGAGLFCYDFSGKQIWRVDLGPLDQLWGLASSPILFGSTVIQLCDCEKDSYLAAYDKTTGQEVWRTPRNSKGCWSTPVLIQAKSETDGRLRDELIVNGGSGTNSRKVIAYDPVTGRELWRADSTTDLVTPTPLVCDGLIYSISGRNGPILAIRPGGAGDVSSSHIIWQTSNGGPYIPSGICYRNRLYVLFDNGSLTCFNPGNGEKIWQTRLAGPFTSSLVAADGRLYAVNEHGRAFVVAAGDSFQLLAKNELHSPCLATPAIVNGELLVRTESELFCFTASQCEKNDHSEANPSPSLKESEKKTPDSPAPESQPSSAQSGKAPESTSAPVSSPQNLPSSNADSQSSADWPLFRGNPLATGVATTSLPEKLDLLWTFTDEKGGFESTAAIVNGVVYVGSTSGKFFAFDLAKGEKRWEFATSSSFTASPAVLNSAIFVGDIDGRFHCIDAATGRENWFFDADAEIDSSANFHGEHVVFGSQDANFYCLDHQTGKLIWKFENPDQIRCFPTVWNDLGFVAGCDGRLHSIDLLEGKQRTQVEIQGPTGCSPAVLNGLVFVGTEGGQFFAIDPQEAKVVWKFENPNHGVAFRSSAAATPQAVVVGSRDKQVRAFDPASGHVLWTFAAKGRVDSSPVAVDNRIFVGSSDGRLYALDLKTGESVWQFEAGGAIVSSPAVAEDRLVIGNDSGSLYCFGAKDSK